MYNNKKIYIFLIVLLSFAFAKERYITREGVISFFSSTPLEDIKAINKQVSCVLDKSTGEVLANQLLSNYQVISNSSQHIIADFQIWHKSLHSSKKQASFKNA